MLHLAGAAAWLGGLCVLAVALFVPRPRLLGAREGVARFSTLATGAIALVVVTGVAQSLRQVGVWSALVDTSYGKLLCIKVLVVAGILLVASRSRNIVRNRLSQPGDLTTRTGRRSARDAERRDLGGLRRLVCFEVASAVVVLALTATLISARPARDAITERVWRGAPFSERIAAQHLSFELSVTPGHTGKNDIRVTPRAPSTQVAPVLEAGASISQPDAGIAKINVALTRDPDGSYRGVVNIPIAGLWKVDLTALRTEIDESRASTDVPIGTAAAAGTARAPLPTTQSAGAIAAIIKPYAAELATLIAREPTECDATAAA